MLVRALRAPLSQRASSRSELFPAPRSRSDDSSSAKATRANLLAARQLLESLEQAVQPGRIGASNLDNFRPPTGTGDDRYRIPGNTERLSEGGFAGRVGLAGTWSGSNVDHKCWWVGAAVSAANEITLRARLHPDVDAHTASLTGSWPSGIGPASMSVRSWSPSQNSGYASTTDHLN